MIARRDNGEKLSSTRHDLIQNIKGILDRYKTIYTIKQKFLEIIILTM